MKRLVVLLFVLALLPTTPVRAQDEPSGLPAQVSEATVSSYVDGDKIKVKLKGSVQELNFIGADAPEPKECYATEANAAIRTLLPKGTVVYVEIDTAAQTDAKDRILRHVWAEGKGGKAYLVNAKLIRDGIAGWKSADAEAGNDRYADRYEKAQVDAKRSKNGLWAECDRLHSKARTKSARATSEARAKSSSATEVASRPVPTDTPVVVDDYFATGPATPAERAYILAAGAVTARITAPNDATTRILSDPDFDTDVQLFLDLVEALRPYHGIYASWLELTPPTARLEAFHQAATSAFYNYDQAATNFELFVSTADITYVYATTANLEAATTAFELATAELEAWRVQAGM